MRSVDILVIGGGINGTAIACEAASRGLTTFLAETGDIAGGASSSTTGLLSAGLRQLETLDWDSVKRALNEQAIMQCRAPHLVHSRQCYIVPNRAIRSHRRIKAGLYLYHLIQSSELQPPLPVESPELYLKPEYQDLQAFVDCTVSDIRLTLSTALLARELGAEIHPHCEMIEAQRHADGWQVCLQPREGTQPIHIQARALVNAGGRHVNEILQRRLRLKSRCIARLLRGDHLVINKPFNGEQGYVLQADNRRLIYLLPYGDDHAVLGATQSPAEEKQTDTTHTLLELYNRYFLQPLNRDDVVHHFSGVHALYDDPTCEDADKSPDYLLDLDCPSGHYPLLNVFGGWLTTSRLLAEQALDILQPYTRAPINRDLKQTPLPGGDMIDGNPTAFFQALCQAYPRLPESLLQRLARNYGTLTYRILAEAQRIEDLGRHFGGDLFGAEVRYLCHQEWAQSAEDILWRRTKLGLVLNRQQQNELSHWLDSTFA